MVARSGLFVAPLPGTTPQGTSPTDGRLVLGSLFGTAAGCIAGGTFTSSATQMQVSVSSSVWRIPDPTNSAAVFLSPGDPYTFAFSAGPASGSRKDVLWVKQDNYENGDADSRLTYGIQVGVAASPGTEPAIATAGAMKIGVLTVPSGATNAAACTFVPALPTTLLTPNIAVATEAQLPAAGAFYGQLAVVSSVTFGAVTAPVIERWNGTAWKRWDSDWIAFQNFGYQGPDAAPTLRDGNFRYRAGRVLWEGILVVAGTVTSAALGVALPVSADTTRYGLPHTLHAFAKNASDGYRNHFISAYIDTGNVLRFVTIGLSGSASAPGYGSLVQNSTPFNEAWANNDQVVWSFEYDPV